MMKFHLRFFCGIEASSEFFGGLDQSPVWLSFVVVRSHQSFLVDLVRPPFGFLGFINNISVLIPSLGTATPKQILPSRGVRFSLNSADIGLFWIFSFFFLEIILVLK